MFEMLTLDELYDVLQLREGVFQVEQRSIYQDCDGLDKIAEHLLGYEQNDLTAYLRFYEKEQSIHIGRIVLTKLARGKGFGREMMERCLSYIHERYPEAKVEMSAQTQLQSFYKSLGFKSVGKPYDDAGVQHIRMVLSKDD